MANILIRNAAEDDLQGILSLYARTYDNGKVLKPEQAHSIFTKIGTYPAFNIYVAMLDNHIVGTFGLLIMDNLAHMGYPSGIVENVVVDPDYHGRGIGRQMMEYSMKICRDMNCYKMALSSWVKLEEAHKFYESLGFKKHGYSFVVDLL